MKKALVLIDDLFQDAEVIYPYYRLIEAGFEVDLVGEIAGKEYVGKSGYGFVAGVAASDVVVDEYEIVIVPGGWAPDKMRIKADFVRIVKEADEKGKVIGSICHGAWLLVEADVLRGRRMTCYVAVKTDVVNAGAKWEDSEVIVDGRMVTSRKPADLPAFMREILRVSFG